MYLLHILASEILQTLERTSVMRQQMSFCGDAHCVITCQALYSIKLKPSEIPKTLGRTSVMRLQMWTSAARPTMEMRQRRCLASFTVAWMSPGSHVDSAAKSTSTCSQGA